MPYAIVAISKTAQMQVITPPIGKINRFMPGTTNGASEATTRVWIGGCTTVLLTVASRAKTPETNDASPESRVALTWRPAELRPVRVTVGARSFSSSLLKERHVSFWSRVRVRRNHGVWRLTQSWWYRSGPC